MDIKYIFCFNFIIINKNLCTPPFNVIIFISFFVKYLETHPKKIEFQCMLLIALK